MSYDPTRYSIMVRKERIHGEELFVGRVSEFPDVEVFEDTFDDAYGALLEVINNLKEGYAQIGKAMPEPLKAEEDYSGKVTYRMSNSLHARVARRALEENVSVNTLITQYVVSGLTESICTQKFNETVGVVANNLTRSGVHQIVKAIEHSRSSKWFTIPVKDIWIEDNDGGTPGTFITHQDTPYQFIPETSRPKRVVQ